MKNTIKFRRDFEFSDPKVFSCGPFIAKYRPKLHGDSQYALVASKRTFHRAVDRNRARRLIRAWLADTGRPSAVDILFIARSAILDTALSEGVGWMKCLFKTIKKSA